MGCFWGLLARSCSLLGVLRRLLERLERLLGPLGLLLGCSWGLPGPSWGRLGPVLEPLRAALGGRLGPVLGPLGAVLGRSWGLLGPPGAFKNPSNNRSETKSETEANLDSPKWLRAYVFRCFGYRSTSAQIKSNQGKVISGVS